MLYSVNHSFSGCSKQFSSWRKKFQVFKIFISWTIFKILFIYATSKRMHTATAVCIFIVFNPSLLAVLRSCHIFKFRPTYFQFHILWCRYTRRWPHECRHHTLMTPKSLFHQWFLTISNDLSWREKLRFLTILFNQWTNETTMQQTLIEPWNGANRPLISQ